MERTSIDAVRSYELLESGVVFECETDRTLETPRSPDRIVPVCLQFLTPTTFRFSLQANPEAAGSIT